MTIEELTELVALQTENINKLVALAERTDARTNKILDGIEQLAQVARNHELRIQRLEGRRPQ